MDDSTPLFTGGCYFHEDRRVSHPFSGTYCTCLDRDLVDKLAAASQALRDAFPGYLGKPYNVGLKEFNRLEDSINHMIQQLVEHNGKYLRWKELVEAEARDAVGYQLMTISQLEEEEDEF